MGGYGWPRRGSLDNDTMAATMGKHTVLQPNSVGAREEASL